MKEYERKEERKESEVARAVQEKFACEAFLVPRFSTLKVEKEMRELARQCTVVGRVVATLFPMVKQTTNEGNDDGWK